MEKYEFIDVIGEGTYGVVLKCRHIRTNQIVAVKRFKAKESNEYARCVMMRELRVEQLLTGEPQIVPLLDAFVEKGQLYLVMEYIPGSLLDLLDERPQGLDMKTLRVLLYTLLLAVRSCHQNGIIHRDIKPENVLVKDDGAALLCDFGFSRPITVGMSTDRTSPSISRGRRRNSAMSPTNSRHSPQDSTSPLPSGRGAVSPSPRVRQEHGHHLLKDLVLSQHQGVMTDYVATRWYRSPEMLLGMAQYNFSVDMWAVGAIMAEAADGEPLLPGKTELEQLSLIQRRVGDFPPSYEALIRKRNGGVLQLVKRNATGASGGERNPLLSPSASTSDTAITSGTSPKSSGATAAPSCYLRDRYLPLLGEYGLDLLTRMLAIDHRHRLSADDALAHPFFDELHDLYEEPASPFETPFDIPANTLVPVLGKGANDEDDDTGDEGVVVVRESCGVPTASHSTTLSGTTATTSSSAEKESSTQASAIREAEKAVVPIHVDGPKSECTGRCTDSATSRLSDDNDGNNDDNNNNVELENSVKDTGTRLGSVNAPPPLCEVPSPSPRKEESKFGKPYRVGTELLARSAEVTHGTSFPKDSAVRQHCRSCTNGASSLPPHPPSHQAQLSPPQQDTTVAHEDSEPQATQPQQREGTLPTGRASSCAHPPTPHSTSSSLTHSLPHTEAQDREASHCPSRSHTDEAQKERVKDEDRTSGRSSKPAHNTSSRPPPSPLCPAPVTTRRASQSGTKETPVVPERATVDEHRLGNGSNEEPASPAVSSKPPSENQLPRAQRRKRQTPTLAYATSSPFASTNPPARKHRSTSARRKAEAVNSSAAAVTALNQSGLQAPSPVQRQPQRQSPTNGSRPEQASTRGNNKRPVKGETRTGTAHASPEGSPSTTASPTTAASTPSTSVAAAAGTQRKKKRTTSPLNALIGAPYGNTSTTAAPQLSTSAIANGGHTARAGSGQTRSTSRGKPGANAQPSAGAAGGRTKPPAHAPSLTRAGGKLTGTGAKGKATTSSPKKPSLAGRRVLVAKKKRTTPPPVLSPTFATPVKDKPRLLKEIESLSYVVPPPASLEVLTVGEPTPTASPERPDPALLAMEGSATTTASYLRLEPELSADSLYPQPAADCVSPTARAHHLLLSGGPYTNHHNRHLQRCSPDPSHTGTSFTPEVSISTNSNSAAMLGHTSGPVVIASAALPEPEAHRNDPADDAKSVSDSSTSVTPDTQSHVPFLYFRPRRDTSAQLAPALLLEQVQAQNASTTGAAANTSTTSAGAAPASQHSHQQHPSQLSSSPVSGRRQSTTSQSSALNASAAKLHQAFIPQQLKAPTPTSSRPTPVLMRHPHHLAEPLPAAATARADDEDRGLAQRASPLLTNSTHFSHRPSLSTAGSSGSRIRYPPLVAPLAHTMPGPDDSGAAADGDSPQRRLSCDHALSRRCTTTSFTEGPSQTTTTTTTTIKADPPSACPADAPDSGGGLTATATPSTLKTDAATPYSRDDSGGGLLLDKQGAPPAGAATTATAADEWAEEEVEGSRNGDVTVIRLGPAPHSLDVSDEVMNSAPRQAGLRVPHTVSAVRSPSLMDDLEESPLRKGGNSNDDGYRANGFPTGLAHFPVRDTPNGGKACERSPPQLSLSCGAHKKLASEGGGGGNPAAMMVAAAARMHDIGCSPPPPTQQSGGAGAGTTGVTLDSVFKFQEEKNNERRRKKGRLLLEY